MFVFFTQKSKFWFYFQLKRLIHDPEIGDFRSNMWSFWRFWRAVLTILGAQKVVFCTFQSCSGVFRKCFGFLLGLNRPTSGSISQQRLFPKIYTLLWGPAEALLNFHYASARVLFRDLIYKTSLQRKFVI